MIYPSPKRMPTMVRAFQELDKLKAPIVVEIGRIRNKDYSYSDGHSTKLFAEYMSGRGLIRNFTSVDIDPATETVCREMGLSEVTFVNEDAIEYLLKLARVDSWIDFIYLDGWDLNHSDCAKNHFVCFMLAALCGASLVLIDDTTGDGGKARFISPTSLQAGFAYIPCAPHSEEYQTLLRR